MTNTKPPSRTERLRFRMIGASEGLLHAVRGGGLEDVVVGTYFKDKAQKVVSFSLSERVPAETVASMLRDHPPAIGFGIWVSLTTEKGQDGLTLPSWLLRFHSTVGGDFDFSVLFCGDADAAARGP